MKPHRSVPAALALGATLVLTGACNAAGAPAAAPGASVTTPGPSASTTTGGNTAQICASSGTASRDAVIGLFTKLAAASGGAKAPDPAALGKIYQQTFGGLGDLLTRDAARATDPEFAAVLREIGAEADKIADAPDPTRLDNSGLQNVLGKLEKFCPSGRSTPSGSTAAGGVVDGMVGAAGSGCVLPVTFKVADKWRPKAVTIEPDDPLAELARKGPLQMSCEIDGKPAGHLGFIRVWTDPKATGDARAALRPFVTDGKTRKVTYTRLAVGGRDAAEVAFERFDKLSEEFHRQRAFALVVPGGVVAVEVGGIDNEEHEGMLPAYELARGSVTVKP